MAHFSLATKVPESAKPAAIDLPKSKMLDFSVEQDLIRLFAVPAVVVHEELRPRRMIISSPLWSPTRDNAEDSKRSDRQTMLVRRYKKPFPD